MSRLLTVEIRTREFGGKRAGQGDRHHQLDHRSAPPD